MKAPCSLPDDANVPRANRHQHKKVAFISNPVTQQRIAVRTPAGTLSPEELIAAFNRTIESGSPDPLVAAIAPYKEHPKLLNTVFHVMRALSGDHRPTHEQLQCQHQRGAECAGSGEQQIAVPPPH
jgi:hypothetical protein